MNLQKLLIGLVLHVWARLSDSKEEFLRFKDATYFNPVEIILLLGLCSPNTVAESTEEVLQKLNDLCLSIRRFKFEVVLKEMPEECFTKLQTMHHMKLLVEWCADIHSHSSTAFGFGQWSVPMAFFSLQ